jgi:hypothetical protein
VGLAGDVFQRTPMETSTAAAHPTAVIPVRAEWLRVPDAMHASGIGRSLLYELIRERKIKSVCLRKRNAQRGIRLISADSLNTFIESAAEGGEVNQCREAVGGGA